MLLVVFIQNTIERGLRGQITAFICQRRDNLAGWQTLEAITVDVSNTGWRYSSLSRFPGAGRSAFFRPSACTSCSRVHLWLVRTEIPRTEQDWALRAPAATASLMSSTASLRSERGISLPRFPPRSRVLFLREPTGPLFQRAPSPCVLHHAPIS